MALWSLEKYRILIVDDVGDMRTMMRGMVTDLGARHVQTAGTGAAALEVLAHEPQDIVLCDYNLGPGKDGQQILEEARARQLLPYAAIVILITAENTLAMVMGALEFEPDDYLAKPFTRSELQTRLKRLEAKKACLRDVSAALQAGDLSVALEACDTAIASHPRYRFELTRTKGNTLLRLGRHAEAETLYRQVLDERELPWAVFGLGRSLFELQQLDDAKNQFERCLELNPHMVSALDWIAQVQTASGDLGAAQQTLSQAVELSPKNTRRQQTLGATALRNGDIATAESAYRRAVHDGRHSIYCTPDTFGGLAQAYAAGDNPDKARRTLGDMQTAFKSTAPEQRLQAALVSHRIQDGMGDAKAAEAALNDALALYDSDPARLPKEIVLAMTQAALKAGLTDKASTVMDRLVRSHHDDEALLNQAQQLFTDAGMESYGADLIGEARNEIVKLNNEGVQLAKAGQLRESVSLLLKAAQSLPDNATIGLNAAQSLILLMDKDGAHASLVTPAQRLIARARVSAPERCARLQGQLDTVLSRRAQ